MKHNSKLLVIAAIIAVWIFIGNAWAQDIKTRMQQRLPTIVDLKARGVVGENNQGFLEMRNGQSEKKDVVAAENQDRQAVYQQIAKQAGTDVKLVGQRRAAQIAEKASGGEWLQDASGKWYKK
jgi:uncharacterized protein YdbL (DUF1318 family)